MINLIYYKNILDRVFLKFIEEYGNSFTKIDDKYVFSAGFTKNVIKNIFKKYIDDELNTLIEEWNPVNPKYYLIIGACNPKNNILLKYNNGKIPNKLNCILNSDKNIKYFLEEEDIIMDFESITKILDDIFNMFFNGKTSKTKKFINQSKNNVIFITHNRLDCYTIFKVIKFLYGKTNCNNLFLEKYVNHKNVLVSVNELIDKYVTNKMEMNRSSEFKEYIEEIKLYIDDKMKFCRENIGK